jgi:hypothetical protein
MICLRSRAGIIYIYNIYNIYIYNIYITYISVYHSIIRAGSGKNFPHNAAPPPTHTQSRASVIVPCGNAGACHCL